MKKLSIPQRSDFNEVWEERDDDPLLVFQSLKGLILTLATLWTTIPAATFQSLKGLILTYSLISDVLKVKAAFNPSKVWF